MEVWDGLKAVAKEAALDREAGEDDRGVAPPAVAPISWVSVGGRRVPILKALLTSACERNCAYCPFRAGRDFRRQTFKPEDLAHTVETLTHRGVIRGVLLSSGIAGGGVATQDRLLKTAVILRRRGYKGYLHLKLMPGAEEGQIAAAMRLADRLSVNLEAPGEAYLRDLAPQKRFWDELVQTLAAAARLRQFASPEARIPSLVTQFVVGATSETDRDLLAWSERLIADFGLSRVYYSAFRPIPATPLEGRAAESPLRVRRLYRAFFLLRDYGFSAAELFPSEGDSLPSDDPKLWWAQAHLANAPVEINTAPLELLLRIPGIGPKRAATLLRARREGAIRSVEQLRALGIPLARAAPFILLDGKRPPQQEELWGGSQQVNSEASTFGEKGPQ